MLFVAQLLSLVLLVKSQTNVTIDEVELHDSPDDCWSAIYDIVYDLTDYGDSHTFGGGSQRVWSVCGKDGTDSFDRVHGNNKQYLTFDGIQEVGVLVSMVPDTTTTTTTAAPPTLLPSSEPQPTTTTMTTTTTTTTTTAPEPTSTAPTSEPTAALQTIVLDEVAMHNTTDDCWVVYHGTVYDITEYAPTHPTPPGPDPLYKGCGTDDTEAFAAVHPNEYLSMVKDNAVGSLEPTDSSGSTDVALISPEIVAVHDNPQDCWVVYYSHVYDMTDYAYKHPPPGTEPIHAFCGDDGTEAFSSVHTPDMLEMVQDKIVGTYDSSNALVVKTSVALVVSIAAIVINGYLLS